MKIKQLLTFIMMLVFILSIVRPSSLASVKSVGDYEWSDVFAVMCP